MFVWMMKTAEVMNSAMTYEAPACPAVRAGSVAHGTLCVALEPAVAMVSRGVQTAINTDIYALQSY